MNKGLSEKNENNEKQFHDFSHTPIHIRGTKFVPHTFPNQNAHTHTNTVYVKHVCVRIRVKWQNNTSYTLLPNIKLN